MARGRAPGRTSGEGSFGYSAKWSEADVRALKRAIADAGAAARKEVRDGLKDAGAIIAEEIRARTPVYEGTSYAKGKSARTAEVTLRAASGASRTYRGRHAPGLLKKSTRLQVGRLSVKVYNSAKAVSRKYPGGYRYGKRIEFDPALGGRFAFFYPGYEAAKDRAKARFTAVLEAARDAFVK